MKRPAIKNFGAIIAAITFAALLATGAHAQDRATVKVQNKRVYSIEVFSISGTDETLVLTVEQKSTGSMGARVGQEFVVRDSKKVGKQKGKEYLRFTVRHADEEVLIANSAAESKVITGASGVGNKMGPVGAASSDPVQNLIPYANSDGSLDVVWRRVDGNLMYSKFSGPNWAGSTRAISGSLGLLGGFTKDDRGNAYILTAKPEELQLKDASGQIRDAELRRPGVLQISRISSGGAVELFADLNQVKYYATWGIYNPFLNGARNSAQLAFGNGSIAAAFGHNIPGSDERMHNTGALAAIDTQGNSTYSAGAGQHTIGNWLWFDGQNFVKVQQGDQGILMSRLTRQGNAAWKWSEDKLVYRHLTAEPGNKEDDLQEFVRFGSVVNAGDRYLLLFAAAPGQGSAGISDKEWSESVKGAALYLTSVPKSDFDALPQFKYPANQVGDGIMTKQLFKPTGNNNCVRPKMVDLGDGNYIVVCEEWDEKRNYMRTMALIMDAEGKVKRVASPSLQGAPRIQRTGDAFLLGNRAGWVSGDNQNGCITLHLLDKMLKLESFQLDCR